MTLKPLTVFLLMNTVFLAACDQQAAFDRLVPEDEAAYAEHFLSRLADGDIEQVEAGLSPQIVSPAIRAELATLSESFPKIQPTSVKLVGSHTETVAGTWRAQFTFEYEYPGQWLLAGVAMHREGPELFVDGINVEHTAESVVNTHRFTLDEKTPAHYAILVAAAAVFVFVVHSLIQCMRAPIRRFKWLWMIFILLGVGTVNLNWTTGAWEFMPVHVLLFGIGVQKLLYSPVIIQVAVPVGAIAFRLRRLVSPT
ncbi:MAG: hypothetical protein O7H40_02110 [Gammaproteobacteria bacterium]|nr:hypothetical protein [Gammaproteobacteria bacterium]